jgi:hypothetical protein
MREKEGLRGRGTAVQDQLAVFDSSVPVRKQPRGRRFQGRKIDCHVFGVGARRDGRANGAKHQRIEKYPPRERPVLNHWYILDIRFNGSKYPFQIPQFNGAPWC